MFQWILWIVSFDLADFGCNRTLWGSDGTVFKNSKHALEFYRELGAAFGRDALKEIASVVESDSKPSSESPSQTQSQTQSHPHSHTHVRWSHPRTLSQTHSQSQTQPPPQAQSQSHALVMALATIQLSVFFRAISAEMGEGYETAVFGRRLTREFYEEVADFVYELIGVFEGRPPNSNVDLADCERGKWFASEMTRDLLPLPAHATPKDLPRVFSLGNALYAGAKFVTDSPASLRKRLSRVYGTTGPFGFAAGGSFEPIEPFPAISVPTSMHATPLSGTWSFALQWGLNRASSLRTALRKDGIAQNDNAFAYRFVIESHCWIVENAVESAWREYLHENANDPSREYDVSEWEKAISKEINRVVSPEEYSELARGIGRKAIDVLLVYRRELIGNYGSDDDDECVAEQIELEREFEKTFEVRASETRLACSAPTVAMWDACAFFLRDVDRDGRRMRASVSDGRKPNVFIRATPVVQPRAGLRRDNAGVPGVAGPARFVPVGQLWRTRRFAQDEGHGGKNARPNGDRIRKVAGEQDGFAFRVARRPSFRIAILARRVRKLPTVRTSHLRFAVGETDKRHKWHRRRQRRR